MDPWKILNVKGPEIDRSDNCQLPHVRANTHETLESLWNCSQYGNDEFSAHQEGPRPDKRRAAWYAQHHPSYSLSHHPDSPAPDWDHWLSAIRRQVDHLQPPVGHRQPRSLPLLGTFRTIIFADIDDHDCNVISLR
jgi:hypothetical protein